MTEAFFGFIGIDRHDVAQWIRRDAKNAKVPQSRSIDPGSLLSSSVGAKCDGSENELRGSLRGLGDFADPLCLPTTRVVFERGSGTFGKFVFQPL